MITKLCHHGPHWSCPACAKEERHKIIEEIEVTALGKRYVREYLSDSWCGWPSNLRNTILWLQRKYEQVPEKYRDAAIFDANAITHSIYYDRLETPEERADRKNRARAADRELAEALARLRAKY